MENTKIEWATHTFNPWIGCTKVSPACDHCYAERDTARFKTVEWGAGKERKRTSESYWKTPLKWNKQAETLGVRYRVFCASLADIFDNEVPSEWRAELFDLIVRTPHLDWLLLTKRIGNVSKMLASHINFGEQWPNVWLGISIVTQEEANRDIPKLINIPAKVRFLSMEPLLEYVDVNDLLRGIHWVIVGGESGAGARPMQAKWARAIRNRCAEKGVPFFFKQWGEFAPYDRSLTDGAILATPNSFDEPMQHFGKKQAGRTLDGRTWDDYPVAVL